MGILGEFASAGLFINRDEAEIAWDHLAQAGIPATVIVDPGLLGKYSVSVEVDRENLDQAIEILKAAAHPPTST
ncbi:MAG: hypothetical protein GWP18_01920 [Proteobacteria bacterium]|nr:hypothetical protein [Pseudomonadota bacterium]